MTATAKLWIRRLAIWLILAAFFLLAMRFIAVLLGIGLSISIVVVEIAGYILLVLGMPFLLWVVAEPVFRIFVKPYIRVWRIRRIRDARYLKEATERDKENS